MTAMIRRLVVLILLLGAAGGIIGCSGNVGRPFFDINSIKSYRDIPGVTDEEKNAIEALKQGRQSFSFGAMISTEAFISHDGTYAGFTAMFCELLSGLFGIPFVQESHSWEPLKSRLDSRIIDFSGELTSTPDRKLFYYMTHPIAERSLGVFTYGDTIKIQEESDVSGLRIGFFDGTVTMESIKAFYPTLQFETVFLKDVPDVSRMMMTGMIDAFIIDAVEAYTFADFPLTHTEGVFPLVYTPVSLATANPVLEPVITVVNKYIEAGGIDKLYELYKAGSLEYAKHMFSRVLSAEEKAYIENLSAKRAKVPIALESDNYPMSFYNETEKSFQGIASDILAEISALTDINFEIATGKDTSWITILEMLNAGEVSLVSELLYSEDRKDHFLWSDRYASSHYALLSKSEYPQLEMYQVVQTTVGIGRQSVYEEMYNGFFPDSSNVKYYDSQDETLNALEKGEVDLVMASENVLLTMRNYREKPGYKINIRFNMPIEESYFGFNKNEEELCSIFRKAQAFINAGKIAEAWTGRVFDYSRKLIEERSAYLAMFAFFLSLTLGIVLFLFLRNSRMRKHFQNQATTLSTIYNTIPDLVYCMDTNLKFINCNRSYEEFTGFSESEIIGKTDIEIYKNSFAEELSNGFMNTNMEVIREGKAITLEEESCRVDNTRVLLKTTKTPLIQNGKIIGLLGIGRDITEHKATEEAAQEASRAKSNFLARMSHEIRTPMNAIIGMTELALRERELGAAQKHILTVKHAGVHLLSIINDILDFSKIEVGKLEIIPVDYYFSSLINDVINIIRMRVVDTQIRFAVFIDSKIPNELNGDETRIRQVFLNILSNAVKYTEKGFVTLSVSGEQIGRNKIQLNIEVMDSGKGIKEENLKKLFGEYIQFDQGINKGIEGVGLGLAITRNIVNAMDGQISAFSEYGKGSMFTVTLPQKIRSMEPMALVGDSAEKSVIIYERRDIFANSIICTIENLGVSCTRVSSDSELYQQISSKDFTFVFISFLLYERNEKIITKLATNTKVVVLAEFGEAIPDQKFRILSMPVYSISIANILNGVIDSSSYDKNSENITSFAAPDARVLIVDDILTNLKVAEGLLLPYRMHVDMCKGGKEAIEAVIFKRYDLIFMDHKMPDMDGVEATLRIRRMGDDDSYYKEVPIVALTANAVSGTKEMFLENGFDDFMSKPIDTVKLNSILRKWLPKEKQKSAAGEDFVLYAKNEHIAESGIEIKGLDVNRGIFLSGGTKELYLETLALFYTDGKEKIKDIRSCLETGNLLLYTVHVHALKSACANIGAGGLSETAKSLEMAGERNDLTLIESNTEGFLADLELLLKNIKDFLSSYKGKAEGENKIYDKGKLVSALLELKTALDILDAGTMNRTIEVLRQITAASENSNIINSISEKILIGEYDEAASLTENLLLGVNDGII